MNSNSYTNHFFFFLTNKYVKSSNNINNLLMINININRIKYEFGVNHTSEYNLFNKSTPYTNKNINVKMTNSALLNLLRGLLILYIKSIPIYTTKNTAMVDICSNGSFRILDTITSEGTAIIQVNDAGKAFFTTFSKKCPFILS